MSSAPDVIRGKLDQLGGQLQVEYAAGRDVRPEAVPGVIATLQAWCQTCDTVMQCIDRQVQTANGEREARARHRAAIEAKVSDRGPRWPKCALARIKIKSPRTQMARNQR